MACYISNVLFLSPAKDATKAFVNGDFTDRGLVDDISDLSPHQMLEAHRWIQFYEKTYRYIGEWHQIRDEQ